MPEPLRVVIVEDTEPDALLMVRELKRAGFATEWVRVETRADYLLSLEQQPEVILSDSNLPQFDGLEALDLLRESNSDIPFILVSGRMGEDLAVDAMKRGADDYLLKDRLSRLGEAVRRAIERRQLRVERESALEALRQSEERYRVVSEMISDFAFSLSVGPASQLTCEWANDSFVRITGFSIAEVNSRGWAALYHSDDTATANQHHATLLSGESDSIEIRILTKEQEIRWVRIYARPIWDVNLGRVTHIRGAVQDITVEKQLQQQLHQAQKMEAIGRLAGGVAHDFNNLLTVIMGYGQIAREQAASGVAKIEYLDEILRSADRASQLTKQLLAFSRKQVLAPKFVNLSSIVTEIEKLLRRLIGEDVELETALSPDLGIIRVDPSQIEQVIVNLAVNARDAMTGGKLIIETANCELDDAYARRHGAVRSGEYVQLGVSDTGTGMDADTIALIFEPFFTTKEPGKGTGLGLATVYGIVKQSGGNIWVYSEPGRGTTFKVYFPRVNHEKSEDLATSDSIHDIRGSETILVVEDEDAVRGLIRQILSEKGYSVLDTGDAREALRLCQEHEGAIALLITDVIMPIMSGPQLAERILEIRSDIRVLYTSGYTDNAIVHHGVLRPGTILFQKPFTPDSLAKKVREVLDSPR